jgi:hypothetical protein
MHFHPGRAAITQGLAIYSWRAPGIQEVPFTTQLPLRHAALGTVAYIVDWEVPFGRPRDEVSCLRGTPAARPQPPHHGKVGTHSGGIVSVTYITDIKNCICATLP